MTLTLTDEQGAALEAKAAAEGLSFWVEPSSNDFLITDAIDALKDAALIAISRRIIQKKEVVG